MNNKNSNQNLYTENTIRWELIEGNSLEYEKYCNDKRNNVIKKTVRTNQISKSAKNDSTRYKQKGYERPTKASLLKKITEPKQKLLEKLSPRSKLNEKLIKKIEKESIYRLRQGNKIPLNILCKDRNSKLNTTFIAAQNRMLDKQIPLPSQFEQCFIQQTIKKTKTIQTKCDPEINKLSKNEKEYFNMPIKNKFLRPGIQNTEYKSIKTTETIVSSDLDNTLNDTWAEALSRHSLLIHEKLKVKKSNLNSAQNSNKQLTSALDEIQEKVIRNQNRFKSGAEQSRKSARNLPTFGNKNPKTNKNSPRQNFVRNCVPSSCLNNTVKRNISRRSPEKFLKKEEQSLNLQGNDSNTSDKLFDSDNGILKQLKVSITVDNDSEKLNKTNENKKNCNISRYECLKSSPDSDPISVFVEIEKEYNAKDPILCKKEIQSKSEKKLSDTDRYILKMINQLIELKKKSIVRNDSSQTSVVNKSLSLSQLGKCLKDVQRDGSGLIITLGKAENDLTLNNLKSSLNLKTISNELKNNAINSTAKDGVDRSNSTNIISNMKMESTPNVPNKNNVCVGIDRTDQITQTDFSNGKCIDNQKSIKNKLPEKQKPSTLSSSCYKDGKQIDATQKNEIPKTSKEDGEEKCRIKNLLAEQIKDCKLSNPINSESSGIYSCPFVQYPIEELPIEQVVFENFVSAQPVAYCTPSFSIIECPNEYPNISFGCYPDQNFNPNIIYEQNIENECRKVPQQNCYNTEEPLFCGIIEEFEDCNGETARQEETTALCTDKSKIFCKYDKRQSQDLSGIELLSSDFNAVTNNNYPKSNETEVKLYPNASERNSNVLTTPNEKQNQNNIFSCHKVGCQTPECSPITRMLDQNSTTPCYDNNSQSKEITKQCRSDEKNEILERFDKFENNIRNLYELVSSINENNAKCKLSAETMTDNCGNSNPITNQPISDYQKSFWNEMNNLVDTIHSSIGQSRNYFTNDTNITNRTFMQVMTQTDSLKNLTNFETKSIKEVVKHKNLNTNEERIAVFTSTSIQFDVPNIKNSPEKDESKMVGKNSGLFIEGGEDTKEKLQTNSKYSKRKSIENEDTFNACNCPNQCVADNVSVISSSSVETIINKNSLICIKENRPLFNQSSVEVILNTENYTSNNRNRSSTPSCQTELKHRKNNDNLSKLDFDNKNFGNYSRSLEKFDNINNFSGYDMIKKDNVQGNELLVGPKYELNTSSNCKTDPLLESVTIALQNLTELIEAFKNFITESKAKFKQSEEEFYRNFLSQVILSGSSNIRESLKLLRDISSNNKSLQSDQQSQISRQLFANHLQRSIDEKLLNQAANKSKNNNDPISFPDLPELPKELNFSINDESVKDIKRLSYNYNEEEQRLTNYRNSDLKPKVKLSESFCFIDQSNRDPFEGIKRTEVSHYQFSIKDDKVKNNNKHHVKISTSKTLVTSPIRCIKSLPSLMSLDDRKIKACIPNSDRNTGALPIKNYNLLEQTKITSSNANSNNSNVCPENQISYPINKNLDETNEKNLKNVGDHKPNVQYDLQFNFILRSETDNPTNMSPSLQYDPNNAQSIHINCKNDTRGRKSAGVDIASVGQKLLKGSRVSHNILEDVNESIEPISNFLSSSSNRDDESPKIAKNNYIDQSVNKGRQNFDLFTETRKFLHKKEDDLSSESSFNDTHPCDHANCTCMTKIEERFKNATKNINFRSTNDSNDRLLYRKAIIGRTESGNYIRENILSEREFVPNVNDGDKSVKFQWFRSPSKLFSK